MTGKQEGPYKGEETKAEEDKVWQFQNCADGVEIFVGDLQTTLKLKNTDTTSHLHIDQRNIY